MSASQHKGRVLNHARHRFGEDPTLQSFARGDSSMHHFHRLFWALGAEPGGASVRRAHVRPVIRAGSPQSPVEAGSPRLPAPSPLGMTVVAHCRTVGSGARAGRSGDRRGDPEGSGAHAA